MDSRTNHPPDRGGREKESPHPFRQRAEEKLRAMRTEEKSAPPPADTSRLLHELRVHQIELEMQNEELRCAQQQLEAARARYFDLYDLAPVGYLTLNEQCLILEANLTAAKLLQTTVVALVNQPLTRFILPEDQDHFYHHRRQLFETGQLRTCELRLRRPGGDMFWARLDGMAAREAASGAPVCRVTMNDISEQKRMEENNSRLATAAEQASEAIMITDAAANIQYVNPAFERITGYTRGEVLGRNPRLLQSGKHDAEFWRRLWQVLTAGEVWSGHFVNKRKDGAFYEEEASITPVRDARGAVVQYVAVKHDVTREIQLQEQLRQAQKMEAVGRLAGGVAHDFNNILEVILMQAGLETAKEGLTASAREAFATIKGAAERAAALTRQLLAFSRKQTLQPRVLDLNALIANLTKMLSRLIGEDVHLATHFDPALGRVKADPGQIEQVIINLAVNARDAMPRGGTLTLQTANVELNYTGASQQPEASSRPYVMLSLSDTGTGMTDEVKAHMFEPFFTTKEMGKGTGLGLATVHGIVTQSGGHITVSSELGRGTTFKIYLPRVEGVVAAAAAPKALAELPPGTETILLVEDDALVRQSVSAVLQRCGYTVLEAAQGMEALEIAGARGGALDLLVTDMIMPGLNGRMLAQTLLAKHPRLRLLFMSGHTGMHVFPEDLLARGAVFLQKPFTLAVLARAVREALDAPVRSEDHSNPPGGKP